MIRVLLVTVCVLAACTTAPPVRSAQPVTPQPTPGATPATNPGPVVAETPGAPAGSAPGTLPEQPAEDEAAALRSKEEAELAAQEAAKVAAEERRKEAEGRLKGRFDEVGGALSGGQDDEAIALLRKTVQELPEAHAAFFNLGLLLERKGDRDGAIEAYQNALAAKPDYELASENLTRIYLRTNQFQRAEGELRKRILANPRILGFRNQLVRVLIEQGGARVTQAEAEAKKILKVDERNVDAMVNLATIWFRSEYYELAKQVLDQAREIDPANPALWNLLAFTLIKLDQKSLALDSFKKAADLRPDFPEAHNNLGAMLNEVNDCDGAIRELELAVRYAPDWAQARMNLGNAYRCGRQYQKAQSEYEKALELDKVSGAARRMNDPYFNLAILYLDGDDSLIAQGAAAAGEEKLVRLRQSATYFDQYTGAGGDDPRTARYLEEAKKAIEKESKRLERVAEKKRKDEEKARADAEKKRLAEEKARAEAERKAAEIERQKVGGKSDFESDQPPAPTPAPTVAPNPVPAVAPTPTQSVKLPKEDL